MKGKLTAEAIPAEGGIIPGFHAHVYRTSKKGGGKETVYRSPHAFVSERDALLHAQQWAEVNAEENE